MKNLPLITERLVLRDFVEPDWQGVHEYASNPEVVRYMTWGPNTEEESRNFIRRAITRQQEQPRRVYEFAVVARAENRIIGGCGIHISHTENKEGWIYYCLSQHSWGQGYATEAVGAVLVFGFDQLKLHRIFAICDPENVASIRILEKIGMRREGHLRKHEWRKGNWHDSFLYAILNHEWK